MSNAVRGRPVTKPPNRAVNVRMPLDIINKLDEAKEASGLPYSDVIIAALRRQFGLLSPVDQLGFKGEDG